MRLRKKCVYICYICIAVNQCCKKMLLRKKKKGKENSFNFENKNKKKVSNFMFELHSSLKKTNFLWYKNLLQHSCALFDAMIAKLSPQIPPFNFLFMFFSVHFFCLLINQPSNLKIHTEIKPPPPRKKNLLRLCSLQVINTSSHILCLFVMVNKKKTKK